MFKVGDRVEHVDVNGDYGGEWRGVTAIVHKLNKNGDPFLTMDDPIYEAKQSSAYSWPGGYWQVLPSYEEEMEYDV